MKYYEKSGKIIYSSLEYVYEVTVNAYTKFYFSQINSKIYTSKNLLPFVESYFPNKHVEIACELIGAPLDYLLSEGYKEFNYIKHKRKKK